MVVGHKVVSLHEEQACDHQPASDSNHQRDATSSGLASLEDGRKVHPMSPAELPGLAGQLANF
jgi:hypothetical protein